MWSSLRRLRLGGRTLSSLPQAHASLSSLPSHFSLSIFLSFIFFLSYPKTPSQDRQLCLLSLLSPPMSIQRPKKIADPGPEGKKSMENFYLPSAIHRIIQSVQLEPEHQNEASSFITHSFTYSVIQLFNKQTHNKHFLCVRHSCIPW